MSDATHTATVPQAPGLTEEQVSTISASVTWWIGATPEQQATILADAAECVAGGLQLAEYIQGLGDHADAAGFLASANLTPAKSSEATPEAPATKPAFPEVKLDKVEQAYRRGQKGQCKHHLEAGRLAHGFVAYRVKVLDHERSAAIKVIAGKLCDVAGRDVDVNGLIGTFQAYRLLGEGMEFDASDVVPYGTLEAYGKLVERDDATETWSIVDGIVEEAKASFREAAESDDTRPIMPLSTVTKRVTVLDAKAKGIKAEKLAALAANPKASGNTKAKAEQAQRQADKAAEKVAAQTNPNADSPNKADKGKPEQGAPKAEAQQSRQAMPPLRDMAKQGTAKDVAAMASELLTGCDEPDDAIRELLLLLRSHGEVAKSTQRALNAALVLLERRDRQPISPVEAATALTGVANSNGHAAAVA